MMKTVLQATAAMILVGAPALAEREVPEPVEYDLTYEISLNFTFSGPDQVEMVVDRKVAVVRPRPEEEGAPALLAEH